MAITVTTLGTAQNKASADPWTPFSSVALATGDFLVLVVACDDVSGYAHSFTWNGIALTQDVAVVNVGNVLVYILSLYVSSGATGNVVVDWNNSGIPTAMTASLVKATDIASSSPFDKTAQSTGANTEPTSTATATLTQADELGIGAVGTEGPDGDTAGTWTTGAGNVSGNEQRLGTTGGGAASNITVSSAAEVLSATTAQTAAKTSITSRDWEAAVATYKGVATAAALKTRYQAILVG